MGTEQILIISHPLTEPDPVAAAPRHSANEKWEVYARVCGRKKHTQEKLGGATV